MGGSDKHGELTILKIMCTVSTCIDKTLQKLMSFFSPLEMKV